MEAVIKILVVEPGKRPKKAIIYNDMVVFRYLISQGVEYPWNIEFVRLENGVVFFRNEEAVLLGLEGNRRIGSEIVAGDFFIAEIDNDGNICSLSDANMEKYRKRFWKIEKYTDKEVSDAYWNTWFGIADESHY